jgi:tripartite-type tricarboxylate transporter receptor subunit TctC
MNITRNFGLIAAVAAGIGLGSVASAQDYPNESINWIIPFSAGSGADTFARTLIRATEAELGVAIVPINRDGGGSSIGTAFAAAQAPDGYTVFSSSDTLALGLASGQWPVTVDQVQGVARVNADYKTLIVPGNSPFQTFDEFRDHALANPGTIRLGGVGARSWSSVFANKLLANMDADINYIPYDGGSQVVSAIVGENIEAAVITSSNINAQVDSGDIRILAHSLGERAADRPDVPTFGEIGYEDMSDDLLWRGVFAPAGTPTEVLDVLSSAIEEAIKTDVWRAYMENQRQQDAFMAHEEFDAFLQRVVAEYEEEL